LILKKGDEVASIFLKIINGELPSYKIYETEKVYAFLALDQINLGHTLVIPKNEVNHFFEMDDNEYSEVFRVSKFLSEVIKEVS
jgi:histidine triad (HIT) family protein